MPAWLPPGHPLLPYARGIEVPSVRSGTAEERLPPPVPGDYAMEQRAAAPFPVVPLFEMLGEPPPTSHEVGEPSLATVAREFADAKGQVGLSHLSELRHRRDTFHERVVRRLSRMRLARERQRDLLLALPGVRADPGSTSDGAVVKAAAQVWAGLNMAMRRAYAEGVSDHDGVGGGVLAETSPLGAHSELLSHEVLGALCDEYLDAERLLDFADPALVGKPNRFAQAVERTRGGLVDLQDEWLALFEEAVEDERCRQLYEIVVEQVVDRVPFDTVETGPPTAAETDYLMRLTSVLLEHDRKIGDPLDGAKLKVYSGGRKGRAGRFVERANVSPMSKMFERVSKARGVGDSTAYDYFYSRFKDGKPPSGLGFSEWTDDMDTWYAFAGRFAEGLVERGVAGTVEYSGEMQG